MQNGLEPFGLAAFPLGGLGGLPPVPLIFHLYEA